MPNDSISRVTVYKLKMKSYKGFSLSNYDEVLSDQQTVDGEQCSYWLHFLRQQTTPAKWYKVFKDLPLNLPGGQEPRSLVNGFVLVVKLKSSFYGITGGIGHIHLKKAVEIEYRFGIDLAEKILSLPELRGLVQKDTSGIVNRLDRVFRGNYNPGGEIDNLKRVLTHVRGRLGKTSQHYATIGKSIQAGNALTVNGSKSFSELFKFLVSVDTLARSKKKQLTIPQLEHIDKKFHGALLAELENVLVGQLRQYQPGKDAHLFLDNEEIGYLPDRIVELQSRALSLTHKGSNHTMADSVNLDDARMPLTSADVLGERIERLRELIPEAFVEGKVDFDRLKAALGEFVDEGRERYGLSWAGKADAIRNIQTPSVGTLVPCPEESVNFDTTENLFIEGDNLEVLKLMQKSYYGKVKMIYIDPPYNTGGEFIYPDNYQEGLQEYLRYSGQVGEGGVRLSTNAETSGRYHSKWLDMMYPRLFLARNLLRDDGIMFVSVDDHELANLRLLMDELFGEEQFIAVLVWKSRHNVDSRNKTAVSCDHEYVLAYGRKLRGQAIDETKYSNADSDPRGPWMSDNMVGLATKAQRPNLHYDLTNPATGITYSCPPKGWRYDRTTMAKKIQDNRILWPSSPDGRPRHKKFLSELKSRFTGFSSLLDVSNTAVGTQETRDLLGEGVFDFPKPRDLLTTLLEQATSEEGIVLDFFAGSGTLADAVLRLNLRDGGHRRFIAVQLPEPASPDSSAAQTGLHTIADICKERIRRTIKQVEKDEKGSLLADDQPIDMGFKVFKLTSSNFKIWEAEKTPQDADALAGQLKLFADHVLPGRGEQDILYELMLKAGLPLTAKIEEKDVAGETAYSIADGLLLICLANPITQECLRAMIDLQPQRVVCLDPAFGGNDQLKTNTVLEMKSHRIEFRTV